MMNVDSWFRGISGRAVAAVARSWSVAARAAWTAVLVAHVDVRMLDDRLVRLSRLNYPKMRV